MIVVDSSIALQWVLPEGDADVAETLLGNLARSYSDRLDVWSGAE